MGGDLFMVFDCCLPWLLLLERSPVRALVEHEEAPRPLSVPRQLLHLLVGEHFSMEGLVILIGQRRRRRDVDRLSGCARSKLPPPLLLLLLPGSRVRQRLGDVGAVRHIEDVRDVND